MTPTTNLQPTRSMRWEKLGAWNTGTVTSVAWVHGGVDAGRGLLASRAGAYTWRADGARGGVIVEPVLTGMSDLNVVAVAFAEGEGLSPATALAATATGRLFRSTSTDLNRSFDSGLNVSMDQANKHWQEISSWAGFGTAVVLEPSPAFAQDHTLFVGTSAGILRTEDDGASWESCNFGLLDEDVLCLACAPDFVQSELLWAGTAGGGFYRSRNSGRAWRESGYGLPDAAVQSLAVSPNFTQDRTLFVGLEEHGIYVSRDGGENWTSLSLNRPEFNQNLGHSVNTLACPQAGLLWAGTEDGLWRIETNRGEAVQVTGAGEVVLSIAATGEGQIAAGIFGSGVWLSADDGTTWEQPLLAVHTPPVIVAVNTTLHREVDTGGDIALSDLFALDSDGFMAYSTDGGVQWLEMKSATPEGVFDLDGAVDATGNGTLFVAASGGLLRLAYGGTDGEAAWQRVDAEAFAAQSALSVDLSPSFAHDQTLLVIGHLGELLLSQDGGSSWRSVTGPWQGQSLLRAHFSPDNPSEVVVLTVQPTEVGHFTVTVWHTVGLGQKGEIKWEILAGLTSAVPAVMMAWPVDADEKAIFLATQHRVVKLFNEGEQGELQVHQHFFEEGVSVTALAPAPDFGVAGTIWVATTAGLYRSVDRGMSWGLIIELPLGLPLVWLEVTSTHLHGVTLGGCVWHAAL
jgi:photosystem II stability/assembly factor-like uncharacterized protein